MPAKLAQQARFKEAIQLFAGVSPAGRQRWYDNSPVWGSFLWYYNYFIMSALAGNAEPAQGGAGVIKSIQVVKESVPTTGGKSFSISTVDAAKTVVMLYGNSYISDLIQRGNNHVVQNSTVQIALSPNIDLAIAEVILTGQTGYQAIDEGTGEGNWAHPYVSALSTSQLTVGLQAGYSLDCYFSWQIIEHKAQTIYPVITSIGASAIVIDWAKVPTIAADVSIIVIEYI